MSVITYLDGSSLTSTALSEAQVQTAFQIATAQALGIAIFAVNMALTANSQTATPTGLGNLAAGQSLTGANIPPGTTILSVNIGSGTITMSAKAAATAAEPVVVAAPGAYSRVRVDWQQEGQPGWSPGDPDTCMLGCVTIPSEYSLMRDVVATASGTTITQTDVYTRAWRTSWTFYGPNCVDHARSVRSALIKVQFIADLLAQSNLYIQPSISEPLRVPENFQGQWWPRVDMSAEFNEQITETTTVGAVQSVQISVSTEAGQFTQFEIENDTVTPVAPMPTPSSTSTLSLTAAANVSGFTAVAISNGQAVTASSALPGSAVGIATGGAIAGATVTVQYEGLLSDPSWSWTPNQPIFIASNGVLTQSAPTVGYSQIIGYPIGTTSLLIDIQAPITLN